MASLEDLACVLIAMEAKICPCQSAASSLKTGGWLRMLQKTEDV